MLKVLFFGKRKGLMGLNKPVFKQCIQDLTAKHNKKNGKIRYVFVGDEELLEINLQYLKHNTYTDIITFDLGTTPHSLDGEIYISIDRVIENASIFKTQITEELLRVMFHGVLHLLGKKDKTTQEKNEMRRAEDDCLNLYRETMSSVSHETKQ